MIGRRALGRAVFFGLGYVVGTRAGRERYAQIETGTKAFVARLRDLYADGASASSPGSSGSSSRSSGSSSRSSDPYADITLGK
ncbi:hypothetical protein GCM10009809_25190 [Isoptericola hypogeus]|uniref:YtxH domain-containing protein n=1 Tax=Isoptericola hypogeus TaxID=300179 RepID=A0ABN2JJG2_9MICO